MLREREAQLPGSELPAICEDPGSHMYHLTYWSTPPYTPAVSECHPWKDVLLLEATHFPSLI